MFPCQVNIRIATRVNFLLGERRVSYTSTDEAGDSEGKLLQVIQSRDVPSTARAQASHLRVHIIPALGMLWLNELSICSSLIDAHGILV